MHIPLDIQVLNTVCYWRKKGFSNFRIYENGRIYGFIFSKGKQEGRVLFRNNKTKCIEAIKKIIN